MSWQKRPLLVPLTKSNGGHGSTVLYGYRYALQNHADYIFQTDSDGQTNPAEFEPFWEKRNSYDAVIGNRRERGDGKSRKFVENTVCFLLRLVFGVRIPDANAPFRLMRAELVARYIGKLLENYNLPNIMFTTYFVHYKEKVVFLPISFQPRQAGTNSLNLKKIAKIGIKAVRDFYMLKKDIMTIQVYGYGATLQAASGGIEKIFTLISEFFPIIRVELMIIHIFRM